MTTQDKPQPTRTINIVNLAEDLHVGTLTMISVCRPSWFEELLLMSDRKVIRLNIPDNFTRPQPQHGNLLVLGMERTQASPTLSIGGEAFCILPEELWPAVDSQFDDFVGSLRSCMGQQIRWQATVSGTAEDSRLGKIIVQYESNSGLRRFAIAREDAPVSRKISVPRTTH